MHHRPVNTNQDIKSDKAKIGPQLYIQLNTGSK